MLSVIPPYQGSKVEETWRLLALKVWNSIYTDHVYTSRYTLAVTVLYIWLGDSAWTIIITLYLIVAGPISRKLFDAIRQVETGSERDPENAVGDGGMAIGPYQIHEVYWRDAKDYDPSLVANGETYKNCMGGGSYTYSERVMQVWPQIWSAQMYIYT